MARTPIPVWVVTGPLGVGKTTVIAQLLASKPAEEDWVVLLNEFTDAGIDALTVAAAARGAFDVRLVPGGCLCCAGEADFRRNLLELIHERRPARIVVEPSGIGHPVGIVEELLGHEASGELRLEWVLGLLDASQLSALAPGASSVAAAAVQIADALVLTKADIIEPLAHRQFFEGVERLYPPKRWSGAIQDGVLPTDFFESMATLVRLPGRVQQVSHHHDRHDDSPDELVQLQQGERLSIVRLGRVGARWVFPRAVAFSRSRLAALFAAGAAPLGAAAGELERFKAVVRIAEDEWILLQWAEGTLSMSETAWRRDNRIELQCRPGSSWSAEAWDQLWLRCQVS
jgi:G3E family GTPase